MQITLTKEQVREAFGELRYMGADYCYKYDKETRKKTEEVEALKLHLGSMKLGNSLYTFPFPVTTRIPLQEILSTNTGKFPLCT